MLIVLSGCGGGSAVKDRKYDSAPNLDAQAAVFRSRATQEEIDQASRIGQEFEDDLEALIEERLRAARLAEMRSLRLNNIIYFTNFGTIAPESQAILERHTLYLSNNTYINFELEAHTRALGTRSFNLGYGELLASRIWAFMQGYGVESNRIQVITYGEQTFRPPQSDPTIEFGEVPLNKEGSSYIVIRY